MYLQAQAIGAEREVISEIVFNTSMTGYLEVLTDPSYAGQAVVMTYPLIGNYGICHEDMESPRPWVDGYIVRELSRLPSNFRSQDTIQSFLEGARYPGDRGNRHQSPYPDLEGEGHHERYAHHRGELFSGGGDTKTKGIYHQQCSGVCDLQGALYPSRLRFPGGPP